ncbi:VOC family protein [Allonocardiopsis opalescens]|uniref:Glyoxalase/bleomycin resistance protein/dioxygenase superfamily protein n=1 Tax=Allonocardiopsis opalescens TaxID=1144618 RepID=A0A2T0Q431_9ACTN|nr:VOC family protein [Allonocardiopsis opalescens]PRX98471.1 glyoxalase/bleomycin resistance protein/dioxygenase superfamily protein [Allonocardiopsis opalescens]
MPLDLYAGIYVRDQAAAVPWYTRLLGSEPYVVSGTEAVWELAEHRSVAVEQDAAHADHSLVTVFVDELDAFVAAASARGVEPAERVAYGNGVRKALYRDPDGNEIGFGGAPAG